MLLCVAMVRRVSPNCVRVTPNRVSSSSVSLQASAFAKAVMEAVNSQEFTKDHLYIILCHCALGVQTSVLVHAKDLFYLSAWLFS